MRTRVYKDRNLKIVFLVTLMAVMGVSSITPAFPEIRSKLGISTNETGLLITVFTLPGILLTPLLGVLADRRGRRNVLVPSLFLFAVAGSICAFITDFNLLLLFRFLQGVGAASLASLSSTIIGDLYYGQRLNEAMGYNSGVLGMGAALYPAVGGFLATLGWNLPFLLPITALPVGLMVIKYLRNPEPRNRQQLDVYLKNTVNSFANKEIIGLFITILMAFIILYGAFLTGFPFFMKQHLDASSPQIGLLMSVMSIFSAVTASRLGKLSLRFARKRLLFTGFILYLVSLSVLAYIRNPWLMLPSIAMFGTANGLVIPLAHVMLAARSSLEYRAAFMAVNGMVLRLGQTLGPVIAGLFFIWAGVDGAILSGAGMAAIMLILIKFLIR